MNRAGLVALTLMLAGCGGSDVERRLSTLEQRQETYLSGEESARASRQSISPIVLGGTERTVHKCPEGAYVASITVAEPSGKVSLVECRPLHEID